MPTPAILLNPIAYGPAWTGPLVVGPNVLNPQRGTGQVSKRFVTYVENYEQSAHDSAMVAYVRRLGGASRSPHRAQVRPANTNPNVLAYYAIHGQMSARLAADELQRQWTEAARKASLPGQPPNARVFTVGEKVTLSVQGVRQANGFHYEVTLWYDTADVYVAFHCYCP